MRQLKERHKVEEWEEMEEIEKSIKRDQVRKVEGTELKERERKIYNMSKIRGEQILENEFVGVRKEIPEEEKNKYGDAERVIGIEKLERTVGFQEKFV